jgi:hypothetical protein
VVIYLVLTVLTAYVLRRLARTHATPAPQDVDEPPPDRKVEGVGTRPEAVLGVIFVGLVAYGRSAVRRPDGVPPGP